MFLNLVKFKDQKLSWSILATSCVFLLSSALFFQHYLKLEPCVLCIYQRIAIIGIFISAILPLIFGLKSQIAKLISYPLWISSASFGLYSAIFQWYETYQSKLNPFFLSECGRGLESIFPWILDHKILTDVFVAKGICTNIDWHFLGLEMHHYMTLFFSCFLLSGIFYTIVSLVQFFKKKDKNV